MREDKLRTPNLQVNKPRLSVFLVAEFVCLFMTTNQTNEQVNHLEHTDRYWPATSLERVKDD